MNSGTNASGHRASGRTMFRAHHGNMTRAIPDISRPVINPALSDCFTSIRATCDGWLTAASVTRVRHEGWRVLDQPERVADALHARIRRAEQTVRIVLPEPDVQVVVACGS